MVQFQSLDTRDLPRPQRLWRYTQMVSETYSCSSIRPHRPEEFDASLCRVEIGRIGLTWVEMSPATVVMDGGRIGPWSASIGDAFLIALQESGTCTGQHLGREIVTRPGDMVLLDPAPLPWQFTSNEPVKCMTIKLPADRVLALVGDAEKLCGVRLDGSLPRVALASTMLDSIRHAVCRDFDELSTPHYEELLFSIIATILVGPRQADDAPKSRSLLRSACAIVERRISDPELDVSVIAADLGTSTRTVQRIFLEIGFTPRSYILDRRIERATERLRHGGRGASITDIALSLGFNELSHFSRSFTRKMGLSPKAYRINH